MIVLIIWIIYRKINKITPKMSASSNEIEEMLIKFKEFLLKIKRMTCSFPKCKKNWSLWESKPRISGQWYSIKSWRISEKKWIFFFSIHFYLPMSWHPQTNIQNHQQNKDPFSKKHKFILETFDFFTKCSTFIKIIKWGNVYLLTGSCKT
jgi:hypothetical protein